MVRFNCEGTITVHPFMSVYVLLGFRVHFFVWLIPNAVSFIKFSQKLVPLASVTLLPFFRHVSPRTEAKQISKSEQSQKPHKQRNLRAPSSKPHNKTSLSPSIVLREISYCYQLSIILLPNEQSELQHPKVHISFRNDRFPHPTRSC